MSPQASTFGPVTLQVGDYSFGRNEDDFYINSPEAIGQACLTRLGLFQGEWFLNTADGTPWTTKVLGKYTGNTRDAVIQSRILGTPGVLKIDSYSSSVDPTTRIFSVTIIIDTIYGQTTIATPI